MKKILLILTIILTATFVDAGNIIIPKEDADRKNMVNLYQAAITDLQTIQNRTSFTNAQVAAALKRMAEIQEKQLRYMKKQIDMRK